MGRCKQRPIFIEFYGSFTQKPGRIASEVSLMHDEPKIVEVQSSAAGPIAWVVGITIVVAAVLIVLFYWHPWSTTSTTNTTTITQPGSGNSSGGSQSNSSSTTNTQPH
jgi:hypothetical protein